MLAGGRKGKLETDKVSQWEDLVERAGDLDIQEVSYAKEAP